MFLVIFGCSTLLNTTHKTSFQIFDRIYSKCDLFYNVIK